MGGMEEHTNLGVFGEAVVSLVLLAPGEPLLRLEGTLRHRQEARSTRLLGPGGHG